MIENVGPASSGPGLIVTEGRHDVEFLKRVSRMLHTHDPRLPDLVQLESQSQVVFIPAGGDLRAWPRRLAPLPQPQFYLFDRETAPTSAERQTIVQAINRRPHCRAFLTTKRATENYLHASAIRDACSVAIEVDDESDIPELLACKVVDLTAGPAWVSLSRRGRNRLRNRIKKTLNTVAVDQMTPSLLAERDPTGEVVNWLTVIAQIIPS